jgi:hypothetical protein
VKRWLVIAMLAAAGTARADCPTTPDDPVCRPWSAVLMPTVHGTVFAPRGASTFVGGGIEVILLAWSDNSEAFGPSQGRVRIDAALLDGDDGTMVRFRSGAQVAFERNASRAFGIPYFVTDFGGLWTEATGRRYFVDAGLGVYAVHRRGLIVDVEVTGVLPFQDPDELGGFAARVALSYALW